jgi:hypothetical protein
MTVSLPAESDSGLLKGYTARFDELFRARFHSEWASPVRRIL